MFVRSIQTLRTVHKLQSLPQRLCTKFALPRSYATLKESWKNVSATRQLKPKFVQPFAIRFASQQLQPNETAEDHPKPNYENFMTKLDSSYRWNGFVGVDQLTPLLDALQAENSNLKLSHEQGLFLLDLCGCQTPSLTSDERISNFQNVWKHLHRCEQITKDHYRIMLQVLQHNRAPLADYKVFLKEYERYNGSPNEVFSQLLAVSGANGNVKQATEILNDMRNLQLALTELDFNSLLLAHARANDMNGVQMVFDSMHAAGITISTETQSTLIVAYMENGEEEKASSVLQKYHGQFQSHEVIKMLRSIQLCTKISQDFVSQLVQQLKPDYVKGPDMPVALRRICVELLYNGKLDNALWIIDILPAPNFQENQDIDSYGVFFLYVLFKANCEIDKIIKIAKQLEDSNKNTRALHVATEIALKLNPPMAVHLMKVLAERKQPLRPQYFWPLMMYNFRRHSEAGILRTLKIMQDFNVECDEKTIVDYVIPRLSTTLTNPRMAVQQLNDVGVKTSLVMTAIVSHMMSQNKWFDVAPFVEAYTTKLNMLELIAPLCSVAVHVKATKQYNRFARLLQTLSNKNSDSKQDFLGQFLIELLTTKPGMRADLHSCKRLIVAMHKAFLSVSPAAAQTIENLLNSNSVTEKEQNVDLEPKENLKIITQKLKGMKKNHLNLLHNAADDGYQSSFIKHPRNMNLNELECHLVELEAKQMNTRGVLKRLLQLCVRENRLERALELKNKCDILNVQRSPGMMASIFDLYIKLEDADNAQKVLQIIKEEYPGFNVDEHKFVDYAALIVKNGQLEDAKKLLQQRASDYSVIGGDYILKNIWNFLTNVAHWAANTQNLPPERNLTFETFAFLKKLGFCRPQNAILGPIVRERLLRGDLAGAINECKQLAQEYKHTPLQFELLSLLVRLSNNDDELLKKYNCTAEEAQQLLGQLTEIVTEIHGEVNMNSGLLLAFAESGSDNQLRRLLITPEFRINEELLLRNCEHLGQEGSVQTLLRLALGARGLNRIVNEQNIYNMLLNNFIKTNNYEKAINLYNSLAEDDEFKISQEFVRNLVKLLKVNNVEIPSNIALKAHVVEEKCE